LLYLFVALTWLYTVVDLSVCTFWVTVSCVAQHEGHYTSQTSLIGATDDGHKTAAALMPETAISPIAYMSPWYQISTRQNSSLSPYCTL